MSRSTLGGYAIIACIISALVFYNTIGMDVTAPGSNIVNLDRMSHRDTMQTVWGVLTLIFGFAAYRLTRPTGGDE